MTKEEIDRIKREVDLVALVRERGIEVKKKDNGGQTYAFADLSLVWIFSTSDSGSGTGVTLVI